MIIGFIEFQFQDLDRGYVLRNINSTVAWKKLSCSQPRFYVIEAIECWLGFAILMFLSFSVDVL